MSDALEYLFQIYFKFVNFIFNDALMFEGVSVGWVLVCIFLFGVLISNILAIPTKSSVYSKSASVRAEYMKRKGS